MTPAIDGDATGATLGEPIQATAILSATTDDVGGTITFTAYADAACAGPAAFTGEPIAVEGDGEYTSEQFVPDAAGDYRWVARYSGDGDHEPAATICGAAELTSTVAPRPIVPQPPIVGPPAPPAARTPLLPVPPVVMLSRIAAPRCLSASAPGTRGSIRYGVSSRSRVTFTVQRRVNSPWPIRATCPQPLDARVDGTTSGRYKTVRRGRSSRAVRRTVTVARGNHRISLRRLIGATTLAPGRYRVLIQARSTAGATTQNVTYLWVLRR